jgi:hypothetical protein
MYNVYKTAIMAIILYGCETHFLFQKIALTEKEECRLLGCGAML